MIIFINKNQTEIKINFPATGLERLGNIRSSIPNSFI
jgi:hypothetical protein